MLEEPGEYAFDDATMFSQSTAMLATSLSNVGLDPALPQRLPDFGLGVVGRIGIGLIRTFAPATARQLDRGNRIDQRDCLLRVVDVGRGVFQCQGRARAVADNMPFRAILAAIGGVRAGARPPKRARTEQLSKATFDQSISSATPNSSSNNCQTCFQTPATCQSRRRRQQVMPQPQPNSCGKYSHGQPVRSTNRMPVSAARSAIGGRPPLRLRLRRGKSGSIRSHSSSVSSGFAIVRSSVTPRRLPKRPLLTNRFC